MGPAPVRPGRPQRGQAQLTQEEALQELNFWLDHHWGAFGQKFPKLHREKRVQLMCLFPEFFEEEGLNELGEKGIALMALTDLDENDKVVLCNALHIFMDRNPIV